MVRHRQRSFLCLNNSVILLKESAIFSIHFFRICYTFSMPMSGEGVTLCFFLLFCFVQHASTCFLCIYAAAVCCSNQTSEQSVTLSPLLHTKYAADSKKWIGRVRKECTLFWKSGRISWVSSFFHPGYQFLSQQILYLPWIPYVFYRLLVETIGIDYWWSFRSGVETETQLIRLPNWYVPRTEIINLIKK